MEIIGKAKPNQTQDYYDQLYMQYTKAQLDVLMDPTKENKDKLEKIREELKELFDFEE